MKIDIATQADIPELCVLLNSLFAQETEFKPDIEAQKNGLNEIISKPSVGDILVIREHDDLVGMVNLLYTVSTALGKRVAILEDMVVSPNLRGKGVGGKLIEFAIEHAAKKECKRITLLTDVDNIGAHKFYERFGFKKSSMIPFRLNIDIAPTNKIQDIK